MTVLFRILLALLTVLMPAVTMSEPRSGYGSLPVESTPAVQSVTPPDPAISSVGRAGVATDVVLSAGSIPARGANGGIGTGLAGGYATWFDAPGLQAAVPWWQPGQDPVQLRVCAEGSRCIIVSATGFCQCPDRHGRSTVADLSPAAFRQLAPLSQGIVLVTLEWPVSLPATDTQEGTR